MENSERVSASEASPGELLRNAREALGISQHEMADRLNWMPVYVTAVEENRFEVLRGAAFVRGYLRAYAKLVAVPEDTLMAAYAALPDGEAATGENSKRVESRIPQVQKKGVAIPAGAAMVVLLVFLLWFWRGEDQQGTNAPAPAVIENSEIDAPKQAEALVQEKSISLLVSPESVAATPDPGETEVPRQSETTVAAAPGDSSAEEPETELVLRESVPVGAAVTADTGTPAAGTPAAADADEGSFTVPGPVPAEYQSSTGPNTITVIADDLAGAAEQSQLQFRFSGDCWLEVRNAADELIYADLRRDGDVLNLSGRAPFRVLLGNAGVVELDYQGEAVAIERRPGRSIAKFSVGEV